jgi:hypothetical protein
MRSRLAMVLGILLALSSGCDIFQTREPEAPTQNTSTFETPTNYDIVLRNLTSAIAENNVENYMRCFVDTSLRPYLFEPSTEEQSQFSQWNLDAERRYFQNMGAALNGSMSLIDTISNKNISAGPPASAVFYMNYALYVPHPDARAPRSVRGSMELYMTEDSLHRWSVYRWVDKKTTADSTWSYLKAWFNR